ncbi:hypothetical protein D7Z54_33255, partial [Salibacterium salarium]
GTIHFKKADLSKSDVGLDNVTNNEQIPISQKGSNDGVAELNSSGVVPDSQLPNDVTEKYYVAGIYTGNGNSSQNIDLGFRPSAVFVYPRSGDPEISSDTGAGLALDGYPAENGDLQIVEIVSNGFDVFFEYNDGVATNTDAPGPNPFRYVAWK